MKISHDLSCIRIIALIGCIAILPSCKENNDTKPEDCQLIFKLIHKVGNENLDLDTIKYDNAFHNKYSVVTLKYFISDIILEKLDGGKLLTDEEHYFDVHDSSTLTFSLNEKIPLDSYSRISFIFGLDTLKNISGRYPNPPENSMEWPDMMGGGYHYMKLEGKYDSCGLIKNYQAHTGQCMGNPNFISIILPSSSFIASKDTVTIEIIMDINEWWVNPYILDLNDITAIMGNQEVQQKLKDNGADIFSVGLIQ